MSAPAEKGIHGSPRRRSGARFELELDLIRREIEAIGAKAINDRPEETRRLAETLSRLQAEAFSEEGQLALRALLSLVKQPDVASSLVRYLSDWRAVFRAGAEVAPDWASSADPEVWLGVRAAALEVIRRKPNSGGQKVLWVALAHLERALGLQPGRDGRTVVPAHAVPAVLQSDIQRLLSELDAEEARDGSLAVNPMRAYLHLVSPVGSRGGEVVALRVPDVWVGGGRLAFAVHRGSDARLKTGAAHRRACFAADDKAIASVSTLVAERRRQDGDVASLFGDGERSPEVLKKHVIDRLGIVTGEPIDSHAVRRGAVSGLLASALAPRPDDSVWAARQRLWSAAAANAHARPRNSVCFYDTEGSRSLHQWRLRRPAALTLSPSAHLRARASGQSVKTCARQVERAALHGAPASMLPRRLAREFVPLASAPVKELFANHVAVKWPLTAGQRAAAVEALACQLIGDEVGAQVAGYKLPMWALHAVERRFAQWVAERQYLPAAAGVSGLSAAALTLISRLGQMRPEPELADAWLAATRIATARGAWPVEDVSFAVRLCPALAVLRDVGIRAALMVPSSEKGRWEQRLGTRRELALIHGRNAAVRFSNRECDGHELYALLTAFAIFKTAALE